MRCPKCSKLIRPTAIKKLLTRGLAREFTCPHCDVWLANQPSLLLTKIITCYAGLSCGVASYNFYQYKHILVPVGILCGVIMLAAHMIDHLIVIDEATIES